MRAIVVGGGISGVSAAYLIKKYTPYDVLLIEKSNFGGKAQSIRKESYLIETGPNGFLENKKETIKLIEESGFENSIIESNDEARRRFIFSDGRLKEISSNPLKLFSSGLLRKKSILNILKEPFIKPIIEDETVENFVKRRLGEDFLNKIIGPMVCGVFAGDPAIMSMESNFKRIKEIEKEHGSLIKGLINLMRNKKAKASSASGGFDSKLLSFKDGISSFIEHLNKDIDKTNDEIISIKSESKGYTLFGKKSEYKSDIVIFAVESYSLANILKNTDLETSKLLNQIPYAPMAVVALGFNKNKLPDIVNSFGYLFALDEIRDVIGVLFDSSIFPFRSTEDKFLIRLMVGGALAKESPFKKNLFQIATEELQRSAKIFAPFEFSYKVIHKKAIPIYTMQHKEIIETTKAFELKHKGIFITGNAFYGISFNDCIKSAYNLLKKIK
ncbi:protoporphyrinogen oxidase [Hippea alviniae]|uniref:protoporphyrinogen oxidase n=1 Tax=Hippea alviniae TaxID=1279027 RepID=UPI0003B6F5BC|nr:protoporphyrinogen oxidase [Hippea alviniae]